MSRIVVDAIQNDQIREHGGLSGLRDENVLESALTRPQQQWHYGLTPDLAVLAAAYGFGLVRNHGYVDGNKRVGFAAAATFLRLNGLRLTATEADAHDKVVGLAAGRVSEPDLVAWIRQCTGPVRVE